MAPLSPGCSFQPFAFVLGRSLCILLGHWSGSYRLPAGSNPTLDGTHPYIYIFQFPKQYYDPAEDILIQSFL